MSFESHPLKIPGELDMSGTKSAEISSSPVDIENGGERSRFQSRAMYYLCNDKTPDTSPVLENRMINTVNFERQYNPNFDGKSNQIKDVKPIDFSLKQKQQSLGNYQFSNQSNIIKQVHLQFNNMHLRQARICIYLDCVITLAQIIAYSRNISHNDYRASVLGLEPGELGNADELVSWFWPPLILICSLQVISHFCKMKFLIKSGIIVIILRSHFELWSMDVIAPLDPEKGYNRVKLWVGTLVWAFQYYIKLDLVNSNFQDMIRIPLIVSSILMTLIGMARLQFSGTFEPFQKDIHSMAYIIGGTFLVLTNTLMVFNGQKRIQKFLISETINRVEKEHELQSILFALEGANVLFQNEGFNDSVRFINRPCEKMFVSSKKDLKQVFQESQESSCNQIKNLQIFKICKYIGKAKDENIDLGHFDKDKIKSTSYIKDTDSESMKKQKITMLINNEITYSINELQLINQDTLDQIIFQRIQLDASDENSDELYQYIQIKRNNYTLNSKHNMLIQIIDQTNLVMFSKSQEDNKFLGMINATVSHELRNPLNSIILQNDGTRFNLSQVRNILNEMRVIAIQQQDKQLNQFQLDLSRVQNQLDKGLLLQDCSSKIMISLTNDLLDLSQMKNGKFRKQEKWFDIKKCIQDIINIQQYKADKKNINVKTKYENCEDLIFSDDQRILQIVLNLLSNSLKFTDEDGTITISARVSEDFVNISVQDTGIGISKQDQKKLFKLFGFLESSQGRNTQGIGLGLAISQKIVHQFDGGDIELESEVGVGSMFSFKFRLGEPKEPPVIRRATSTYTSQVITKMRTVFDFDNMGIRIETQQSPYQFELDDMDQYSDTVIDLESTNTVNNSDKKLIISQEVFSEKSHNMNLILVVDDDQMNIEALKVVIQAALGINTQEEVEDLVKFAKNGRDAVDFCKFNQPDLIFMDLNMPVMDGFEATRLIREQNQNQIHIVGMTGDDLKMVQDQSSKVGMDNIMQKPLFVDKVRMTLEKVQKLRLNF